MQRYDLKAGRGTSIRPRAAQRPGGRGGGGGQGGQAPPANLDNPASNRRKSSKPNKRKWHKWRKRLDLGTRLKPTSFLRRQLESNTALTGTRRWRCRHPSIIYAGANKFFKSLNRGETWTASADLTKQINRTQLWIMGVKGTDPMASKNDGTANYSNLTVIAESPVQPGIIWAGTDDGNVQVSKDGGATFTNVAPNIPVLASNNHLISRMSLRILTPGLVTYRLTLIAATTTSLTFTSPKISVRHGIQLREICRLETSTSSKKPEEQKPAFRRHRIRLVRFAKWRRRMEKVHDRLADGSCG